jgi:sugar porter (SP) family MFS transporter
MLTALRFVAGVGTGLASMVSPLYVSENSPRAIRGALTGMYVFAIVLGIMLAFWINYGAIQNLSGMATYIVPLSMQALPPILLISSMLFCPESPRFLAKQDMWEKASAVLAKLRNLPEDHPYVLREMGDIRDVLESERSLIGDSSWWSLNKEIWTVPSDRKRVLISIALMICQQLTGTNGKLRMSTSGYALLIMAFPAINYYAPQIFRNLGLTGSSVSLFATGIYGVVKLVAVIVFLVFIADSLGRRRSLLWTSVAQGLCMLYIGLYVRISPPSPNAAIPPAGYFALVCIYLFAIFFQFGWSGAVWIISAEIATLRLRAINMSYAVATQWLFQFVISRAVPPMLANVGRGGYGTYIIFFCFR